MTSEIDAERRCPVVHTDYRTDRPAFTTIPQLGEERELARAVWNDSTEFGFLMVQRYDDVMELLKQTDVLVSDNVNRFAPNMQIPLIPNSLNPPEHTKVRRVLNPFFSPAAVKRLATLARERAESLIGALTEKKSVTRVSASPILYPTELFLPLLGLPTDDGKMVLPWVEAIFGGFFASTPEQLQAAGDAVASFNEYFGKLVDERSAEPGDPGPARAHRLLVSRADR